MMDSSIDCQTTPPPAEPPVWLAVPEVLRAGFGPDPDLAVAALGATPGSTVFVVDTYGGGEAALAQLARGAHVVVSHRVTTLGATSVGAAGGAVLQLKRAAIQALDHETYLAFIGLLRATPDDRRIAWQAVRPRLDPVTRAFWDRLTDAIAAGLVTLDAETAFGRLLRNLMRTHLPTDAWRALVYGDTATRLATFDARISGCRFWMNAMRLCAVRARLGNAPEAHGGDFATNDPMAALRRMAAVGFNRSPVWARAFGNDASVRENLPAHLRPAGFAMLEAGGSRLRVAGDPVATLAAASERFDGFDLGALPDLVPPEAMAEVLERVAATARPGARCFMLSADGPEALPPLPARLAREVGTEAALAAVDRSPIFGRPVLLRVR